MAAQRLFIVGGNGFLGSAIAMAAVGKGWGVVSLSNSGTPYRTSAGHSPAWTEKVQWHAGDALDPSSYAHLLQDCTAAVHTVGTLLESDYKGKRGGGVGEFVDGLLKGWMGGATGKTGLPPYGRQNPLSAPREDEMRGSMGISYERMNRDTTITVARTFRDSRATADTVMSPFVYISAEDIFRPIVDKRYITTKRQAESAITAMALESTQTADVLESDGQAAPGGGGDEMKPSIRPIFVRPGLMYHPHIRPLSTLPATLFDLSATLHRLAPTLPFPLRALPTPADVLSALSSTSVKGSPVDLSALSRLLTLPPLHVETVARAVCESIARRDVQGVVDTWTIRRLAGWKGEEKEEDERASKEAPAAGTRAEV